MVKPNRKSNSHSQRNIFLVLPLAAFIYLINVVILSVSIPNSQPLMHTNLQSTKTVNIAPYSEKPEPCPDYGCPLYPPEMDPLLRQRVLDTLAHKNQTGSFSSFGTNSMAMLTQMGKSHTVNQDRAVLISPFLTQQTSEESFLMAIFDGHGIQGHIVAEYVVKDFPERLAEKLNSVSNDNLSDDDIVRMLNETFVETDIYAPPNALFGGCTGSVTLRLGSKLYIANVGDSQTIVVSSDAAGISIPYMTRKDKAILPDEYARIRGLGGNVHINPKNNMSTVVVYSVSERDTIMLAMSRSIGDWEWKPIGVTAEPLVDVIDLRNLENAFMIAASDGLWDMRRREFYARQFKGCFYPATTHPLVKMWEVIEKITPKIESWYRDDITAILLKLEGT